MSVDPQSAVVLDINEEIEIPKEGTLSRVVYKDDLIRVVAFAFDQGQELTDHTASKPAVVEVVSGRIRLDLGGEPIEMGPGTWVRMEANLSHAVYAIEPTVMLLTLMTGWKGE